MSIAVNDTFTGGADAANLASRTGEVGATWTLLTGTDAKVTAAGRCYAAGTGVTIASGDAKTADYSVFAEVHNLGGTITAIGIGGRFNNSPTLDGIMLRSVATTGTVQMFKYIAGTPTQLGTTQTVTLPTSGGVDMKLLELRMVGTSVKGIYDAATIIDVTVTDVTRIGQTIIRTASTGSTTTGLQFTRVYTDAVDAVTGTAQTSNRVYQRAVATANRSHTLAGTYAGAVAKVQVQVVDYDDATVIVDWTDATLGGSAYSAGTYTATITVPQGVLSGHWKYRYKARSLDGASSVLATWDGSNQWTVGACFFGGGQSNWYGYGDEVYTAADTGVFMYSTGGSPAWTEMADPWYSGGGASPGPALGNALAAALGCPIGIIPHATLGGGLVGVDGTVWGYRNSGDHTDPTTHYGAALTRITNAGGKIEGVFWDNGASDAVAGTATASYLAALQDLHSWFEEDLSVDVPFVINQVGRSVAAGSYDTGYNNIREAHRQFDNGVDRLLACSTLQYAIINPDIIGGNTSHYGGASQAIKAAHLAKAYTYHRGLVANYGDMRIAGIRFTTPTRNVIRFTIEHRGGADFTPTTGIVGFVFTDSVGAKTVSGAVQSSATTIDVTVSTPCVGPTTFTYMAGKNPAGPSGVTVDDQATPHPLQPVTVSQSVRSGGGSLVQQLLLGMFRSRGG